MELVVEKTIAAPPATVYEYLTESEKWAMWQGQTAELNATKGGIFSILMENGMTARGQFVELIPDRKVVFTWGWIDRPGIPPGSTTVEIDLIGVNGQTRLVLTHRDLPAREISAHREGWETHLPVLAAIFDRT